MLSWTQQDPDTASDSRTRRERWQDLALNPGSKPSTALCVTIQRLGWLMGARRCIVRDRSIEFRKSEVEVGSGGRKDRVVEDGAQMNKHLMVR